MTKSTSSFCRYWRIGIHPPGRKTSGARPLAARGVAKGSSDKAILPTRALNIAVLDFRRFPGIALVVIHANISARTGRSAPADLAPCDGVSVIGENKIARQKHLEEGLGRHVAPCRVFQFALLHPCEQRILIRCGKSKEGGVMSGYSFRIECLQAAPPSLALSRHTGPAVTIGPRNVQLLIDQDGDGNCRSRAGLGDDPVGEGNHCCELFGREEFRLRPEGKTLRDHTPRLVIPRNAFLLRKNVITGKAPADVYWIRHGDDLASIAEQPAPREPGP